MGEMDGPKWPQKDTKLIKLLDSGKLRLYFELEDSKSCFSKTQKNSPDLILAKSFRSKIWAFKTDEFSIISRIDLWCSIPESLALITGFSFSTQNSFQTSVLIIECHRCNIFYTANYLLLKTPDDEISSIMLEILQLWFHSMIKIVCQVQWILMILRCKNQVLAISSRFDQTLIIGQSKNLNNVHCIICNSSWSKDSFQTFWVNTSLWNFKLFRLTGWKSPIEKLLLGVYWTIVAW